MTFPSRKSRRTTRSATIRAGWTSLAALGLTLPLLAQSQPAPTSWKPYQVPQVQSNPVAPPVTVPDMPVVPNLVPTPVLMPVERPIVITKPVPLPVVRPVEVAVPQAPRMPLPPLPEMPVPPQPVAKQVIRPTERIVPLANVTTVATPVQQPVAVRPAVRQTPPMPIQTQAPALQPIQTPPQDLKPKLSDPLPQMATPRVTPASGLPNQEDLFRLDSDAVINARILREIDKSNEKFPPLPPMVPAGTPYVAKTGSYPPMQAVLEPHYVIHRRLFFEEMNSERAGWDAGPAQSVFSTAYFMRDVILLPSRYTSHMKQCYDASPGKCRPGDPTPYYYYPHGVTWFGAAVGVAVYTGMGFIVF